MTQQIESGALTLMNEILQLGAGGEQTTQLDDGNVSQVIDIKSIVRRSLTFASTEGLFFFGYANIHAGAGVLTSSVNPYVATTGLNAFPTVMPRGFDVWLLYATMFRVSGAGALTGASLEIVMTDAMRAKGANIGSPAIPLGIWDGLETITLEEYGITEQGETVIRPMARLRRGTAVQFRSNSAGVATFRCVAVVGAFPAGLGQDGVT